MSLLVVTVYRLLVIDVFLCAHPPLTVTCQHTLLLSILLFICDSIVQATADVVNITTTLNNQYTFSK